MTGAVGQPGLRAGRSSTTATPPAGVARAATTRVAGLLVAVGVLAVLAMLSLTIGAKDVPLATVIDAFREYDATDPDHIIIRTLREPRTELGLLVGLALGLAGALMQGVARNPLADPGILGVNAGAALFVVIAIYVLGVTTPAGFIWFAFFGAGLASVIVYAIGSMGREGATPVKLALAGAALTAVVTSVTTTILVLDLETLDKYRFWAVGSLVVPTGEVAWEIAPFIGVGAVIALAAGRTLNALSLGDDVARGLGMRVGLARAVVASGIVLLCGSAVALAGPIAFVGLMVPHVARALTGPDYRWILPYSAVLAPILLLAADIAGRVITRPMELQVGIVTALIGAPVFVLLVRRRRLAEL